MSQQTIKGTPKLAEAIRNRRKELGLTIEEAAVKAGVGTKTWCRYEAGEAIRKDKTRGLCKALKWHALPSNPDDNNTEFNLEDYKSHTAWSNYICDRYGEAAAVSFVIGSDIVLDHLEEDMKELSHMPRGTHIGQLPFSAMKDILPEQFLMQYDYEFIYHFKITVERLRETAKYGGHFLAHNVMQELAIYLFIEESKFLMECMTPEMQDYGVSGMDIWDEWGFDLFEDMDIVTCLYSGDYLTTDHIYHFDNWAKYQFHM